MCAHFTFEGNRAKMLKRNIFLIFPNLFIFTNALSSEEILIVNEKIKNEQNCDYNFLLVIDKSNGTGFVSYNTF